jgi:hypothetical protein
VIYKLITGEMFISKNIVVKLIDHTPDDSEFIEFDRPLFVSMNATPQGLQVGFLPWGDRVFVKKNSIIGFHEPQKELESQYVQIITGIQLPTHH